MGEVSVSLQPHDVLEGVQTTAAVSGLTSLSYFIESWSLCLRPSLVSLAPAPLI